MVVHQCDFCKKIIKDYTSYVLPVNKYKYLEFQGVRRGRIRDGVTSQKIDLCVKCSQDLANSYDIYLNS